MYPNVYDLSSSFTMVSEQFCEEMSLLYNVQYVLILPEMKLILPYLSFLAPSTSPEIMLKSRSADCSTQQAKRKGTVWVVPRKHLDKEYLV